jgi:hypothetical protein
MTPLPTSLQHVDAALHLAPEGARVDADHQHADDLAAQMPTALNTAASSGMAITPPQKRGARMRCTGSTAIISMALKLLARLHEADLGREGGAGAAGEQQRRARPGPSSRTRLSATSRPSARTSRSAAGVVALQRQHEADEQARHAMIASE